MPIPASCGVSVDCACASGLCNPPLGACESTSPGQVTCSFTPP
jgi:hypothetical protein